jgi:hypothetical protein
MVTGRTGAATGARGMHAAAVTTTSVNAAVAATKPRRVLRTERFELAKGDAVIRLACERPLERMARPVFVTELE